MDEGGRREEKGLLISEFGISLPTEEQLRSCERKNYDFKKQDYG
jgi:hypothetical protein